MGEGGSDEVARRLRDFAARARTHSGDAARLAEDADHAAELVTWTREHVSPYAPQPASTAPDEYLVGIDRAENDLLGAQFNLSSARSYIQVMSSGTAAFASGVIAEVIRTAPKDSLVFELRLPEGDAVARRRRLGPQLEAALPGHDLEARLKGAWQAFHGGSPDGIAQASHSMRAILTTLLDKLAPVKAVKRAPWWTEEPQTTLGVSKRQKIRYFLVGDALTEDDRIEAIDKLVDMAFDAHDGAVKTAHYSEAGGRTAVANVLTTLERVMEELLLTRRVLR